jgi:hypothetical protein
VKAGNVLIAETSKSHLLASLLRLSYPECHALRHASAFFRTPRLKKVAQSTDHQPKTAERPDWVELINNGDPYS